MRFRYELMDGKHVVRTRDDDGTWMEAREYASEEEARRVAQKGEELGSDTIADVEQALTGPKGKAHAGTAQRREEVKPEDLPGETVTAGDTAVPGDKGRAPDDPAQAKQPAKKAEPAPKVKRAARKTAKK